MKSLLIISVSLLALVGCSRHQTSEKPPVHLVSNMDDQPKVKQQSESRFYADGLAMRPPVEGTVARGMLRADSLFYYAGTDEAGNYIGQIPFEITPDVLTRGEERYDIYCAPCHGVSADGKSIMVEKKMPPPPNFHIQRLRDSADGYFFHVITNGLGNMPPYKYQIPATDRWTIVAHVRALQSAHPVAPDTTTAVRQ